MTRLLMYVAAASVVLRGAAMIGAEAGAPGSGPSIELSVKHRSPAKGGFSCHLNVSLRNPTKSPVWFLLPQWYGNELLPRDGVFASDPRGEKVSLDITRRGPEGSSAPVVSCSLPAAGTYGLHVPAGGAARWNDFPVISREWLRFVDVWVAEDITINNAVPLEKWAGMSLLCPARAAFSPESPLDVLPTAHGGKIEVLKIVNPRRCVVAIPEVGETVETQVRYRGQPEFSSRSEGPSQ